MGDPENRGGGLSQGIGHLVADPFPQALVEASQGLVEQHDARLAGKSASQSHSTLLATGELVRVARVETAESEPFEVIAGECATLGPRASRDAKEHVGRDAQMREQGVVLKDQSHATLLRGHPGAVTRHEGLADRQPALGGFLEAGDAAKECRFAAAAGANQRDDLASSDGE